LRINHTPSCTPVNTSWECKEHSPPQRTSVLPCQRIRNLLYLTSHWGSVTFQTRTRNGRKCEGRLTLFVVGRQSEISNIPCQLSRGDNPSTNGHLLLRKHQIPANEHHGIDLLQTNTVVYSREMNRSAVCPEIALATSSFFGRSEWEEGQDSQCWDRGWCWAATTTTDYQAEDIEADPILKSSNPF